jgi:putative transposase
MPNHTLSRGMHFTAGGREYEILKRLPSGGIQVKDIVTNVCSEKTEEEIRESLFRGEVELLGDHRNQVFLKELLKKTGVSDLTILDDDDPRRPEMERRLVYVLEVVKLGIHSLTPESLQPIIDQVGSSLGEINLADHKKLIEKEKAEIRSKPCVSTVIRWIRRYINSGEDARSLIPATKSRGNRKRKFSGPHSNNREKQEGEGAEQLRTKEHSDRQAERVGELINDSINEVFLNEQRFSVQDVYDVAVVKIADENMFRAVDDYLPIPDRSSIYRIINKLDDYEIDVARYGEKIAEAKYRAYGRGPRPTMPLERVEADHTKLDLFVVDPVMMLPIGRPVLTWLVCVYTKMILGFYISFNPYGSLAVMECLKHAIRPKTYIRSKYPSIKQTWNTFGVMRTLVLDNAPEFWGRHLEDACHQLGTNILYGQKGRAWYRATVERSYRTYNTSLIHRQPGTTFSNIFDRADYESGKNALITPDKLDEITHKLIVDNLQLRPHRGINDIPALRWEKGVQLWPPPLPAKASDLDVVLGYIERRQVHHYGIEIDTIIYNDEGLAILRARGEKGKRYITKRNPNDLSLIHVYDDRHDHYIPVPAIDQDYTKGLTLWQHKVIRRYVREYLKRNVDIVALCRAKVEIQEIVEREWSKGKPSRSKMGRWRNEGIQDRREGIETDGDEGWLNDALGTSLKVGGPMLMSPEDAERTRKGISDFDSAIGANNDSHSMQNGEQPERPSGHIEKDYLMCDSFKPRPDHQGLMGLV